MSAVVDTLRRDMRRTRQQVRDADMQRPILQPDKAVGVGEAAKLQPQIWNWRPRLQFPEHAPVNLFRRFEKDRSLNSVEVEGALGFPHYSYIIAGAAPTQ